MIKTEDKVNARVENPRFIQKILITGSSILGKFYSVNLCDHILRLHFYSVETKRQLIANH